MLQYSFIGILAYEYTQNHSYILVPWYKGIKKKNILAHGCFNVFNIFCLFIIKVCILIYTNICKYVLVLVLIYILIPI